MLMKKLVAGAATTVLALCAMSAVAHGQDITGSIAGDITDDAGHGLGGVSVKVTYAPTGQTLTAVTNKDGFFTIRDLQVGGPYSVTASDARHDAKTVQIDQIAIGSPYELNFALSTGVQEVTVRANRVVATKQTQTGPRSTFTANDIQTLPSFQRDLKDIARLNPFVTIDPTNSNALIIAGANPRANTIYVDGVKQSDDFGLNSNGYPTQRSPISLDAVKAFNVEVAPYDVQYGEFEGGVLNIVTKGGSNQLHGGGFYEYDSDQLGGDVLGNRAVNQPKCPNGAASGSYTGPGFLSTGKATIACGVRYLNPNYKDKNYGGYLSGAIIPDKVFFFFDYEKYEGLGNTPYTPTDQGGANPVPGVSTAAVNDVINILKNTYGYNAGTVASSQPTTDTKYFARIDADITDKQHLFVTYQEDNGDTLNFPNGSTSTTAGVLALSSNYYVNQQNLRAWTADLTSHWTEQFSTEFEYTHKTVDTISSLNGPGTAGEFKIQLQKVGSDQPSIYVGPDVSRQANNLSTVDDQYKVKANYILGAHTITVGYEHEDTKSADLFVQNANGTYTFSNLCGSTGYDANGVPLNLGNAQACQLTYANAYDNNSLTAATAETTSIDTGYIQDEWHVLSTLSLKAGLRYERYSVNQAPTLNQTFLNQYGFPNNVTLDGDDILMPRFGFNWRPDPTWTISGGIGLFSGGNPTVYFYDSYDNPGNLLGSVNLTCSGATTGCSSALTGVNINSVGAAAKAANTASANAGTGIVNAVAPNFNIPSEWKASISIRKVLNFSDYGWAGGVGKVLGNNWTVHLDDVYDTVKDGLQWVDLVGEQNVIGTAPDGRPIFNPNRFSTTTAPDNIELKNTHKGNGNTIAVGFGKVFANGWDFDVNYTHEDVKEVTPATSSVAVSNYRQSAFTDPNNPGLALSNYNVDHEVKLSIDYQHKFFGDNTTTFRLFGDYRSGLPFSYTFQPAFPNGAGGITNLSTGNFDEAFGQFALLGGGGAELLYVPKVDPTTHLVTATSDPKVVYSSNFNLTAFNNFLKSTGLIKYAGGIAPRNAFTSSDVSRFDLEITQEIPAFFPTNAKGVLYFDLFNIGNLLDKNWGVIKQTGFPGFQSPIQAVNCQAVMLTAAKITTAPSSVCAKGAGDYYQYSPGSSTTETLGSVTGGVAAWEVKLGVRYKF